MKILITISIIFISIQSCKQKTEDKSSSLTKMTLQENETLKIKSKTSTTNSKDKIESQIKLDSSYVGYWCSSEILLFTEKNIDKLNLVIITDFLATFNENCKNNSEYSEWSNELLFKVLNNKPVIVIELLTKNSSLSRDYIIKEFTTPIRDDIEISELIKKIQNLEKLQNDYWKLKIIESLNQTKE